LSFVHVEWRFYDGKLKFELYTPVGIEAKRPFNGVQRSSFSLPLIGLRYMKIERGFTLVKFYGSSSARVEIAVADCMKKRLALSGLPNGSENSAKVSYTR
jgi:hypothetical protein